MIYIKKHIIVSRIFLASNAFRQSALAAADLLGRTQLPHSIASAVRMRQLLWHRCMADDKQPRDSHV
jgi:hypothetical protein